MSCLYEKLGHLLHETEPPANQGDQGATAPSPISQASQSSQPGGTTSAHDPECATSQISQGTPDVDAVLEQAAEGTDVPPHLLRAALIDEDFKEIRRGAETAKTLHGLALALPETPGLMERAQRRLTKEKEQAEVEPAEESKPLETMTSVTADDVMQACQAFYRHVAEDCCNPAHGRYCATGLRLKADYERASAACDAPLAERLEARTKRIDDQS